jgi:hypothetical protein
VTPPQIACIVEGHGEVEAVPVLIRRIAAAVDPTLRVITPPPLRVPKNKLLKPGELERSVDLAARKTSGTGSVLILLDSDDDCPAHLGPEVLRRATQARRDLPIGVVIAKREFEAWFLAAAPSLRGQRGLPADLQPPADPEAIRGAKEWLSRQMANRYSETLDQPALTARFDLTQALQADSFDKCHREITRLLTSR